MAINGRRKALDRVLRTLIVLPGLLSFACFSVSQSAETQPSPSAAASAALPQSQSGTAKLASKPLPKSETKPEIKIASGPQWADLTPQQRQALAPLEFEWAKIDSIRRRKWMSIASRFASMKPEEQQRLQDRMRDWAKLTPEQRRLARENFYRTKKLDTEQKNEKWQQYQQLSDEQKQKLTIAAAKKKTVTRPPALSQAKNEPQAIPPIKTTPKRILEKSVTPQATALSALKPSIPVQPTAKGIDSNSPQQAPMHGDLSAAPSGSAVPPAQSVQTAPSVSPVDDSPSAIQK